MSAQLSYDELLQQNEQLQKQLEAMHQHYTELRNRGIAWRDARYTAKAHRFGSEPANERLRKRERDLESYLLKPVKPAEQKKTF